MKTLFHWFVCVHWKRDQ